MIRKKVSVSPEILRWTRKSSGFTLSAVAEKLAKQFKSFGEEKLTAWETGTKTITFTQLEALANLYKRPLAAFFLKNIPDEEPLPKDFRRRPSARIGEFSPELRYAMRSARLFQKIAFGLQKNIDETRHFKYDRVNYREINPVELAKKIRNDFNLSFKQQLEVESETIFLKWLRLRIEEFGVITMTSDRKSKFPVSEARGFSFSDETPYLVFINNQDVIRGKVFTVMHEFAHILIRESSLCDVNFRNSQFDGAEFFCNQFASYFLLPENDMIANINQENINNELKQLARKVKVSKYVLLRRMLDNNFISQGRYDSQVKDWDEEFIRNQSRPKFGRFSPIKSTLRSRGKRFSGLVLQSLDSNRITYANASEYLGIKNKFLPQFRKAYLTA